MTTQPLVSICIPTYNGAAFLQQSLDSILAQTFTEFEVIISDDNSSDDTLIIVEEFQKRVNFNVQVLHHTPNGIGANWNNAIKYAKGKYIKLLFQDDVLMPDCIEQLFNIMQENPSVGLASCKREFIIEGEETAEISKWIKAYGNLQEQFENNQTTTFVDKSIFKESFFLQSPLNKIGEPSATLFLKLIWEEVGSFDESLKQILDYEFYYRILKKHPIAIINKPLIKFRIHEKQATNVNRSQNINDYNVYDEILYSNFLSLLHSNQQQRLKIKFSARYRLQRRVLNKLRRTFGY